MKKQPTAPSIAEFYHELTKYSPASLPSGTHPSGRSRPLPDPLQRPPAFKEYLSERTLDLKPYLRGVARLSEEGSTDASRPEAAQVRSLSRLLYHTGGITEVVEGQGGTVYYRAAPSAGGLHPIEIYLASCGLPGLPDAIHSYSVREHALVPAWEGNSLKEILEYSFRPDLPLRPRMFLILTAVFRRSGWRYGDRAYRRILLDAGHVLGNAAAYAPAEGLGVLTMADFYDAGMNGLLFLNPHEEAVLLAAAVVPRRKLLEGLAGGAFARPSSRNSPPPGLRKQDLMLLLHERSAIAPAEGFGVAAPREAMRGQGRGGRRSVVPLGPSGDGLPSPEALAPSIGPAIRRRRSARSFTRGKVPLEKLAAILRAAYWPLRAFLDSRLERGEPERCMLIDPTMICTYLVATRVDGLPAGVYRLDPGSMNLVLKKKGDFSTPLWNLCLGQDLARDAACAVVHLADLPACVERYGDRAYRYLHLDAGHLGERLNLAAVSREVGVCGIGGFFDEEANALLGLPAHISTLYITLLGVTGPRGRE